MALKVITPGTNTGFDPVGVNDYREGMLAARDSSGNVVLAGTESTAGTSGPKNRVIGVLGEDRLSSQLQATTQVQEEVTSVDTVAVALSHNALKTGSVRVITKVGSTVLTGPGTAPSNDFNIDFTNGTITVNATGPNTIPDGTVVLVTYTFELNDQIEKDFRGTNYKGSGDETEGSKRSTVWKGYGEYETDQFVSNQAYLVSDALRVTHSSHAMGAGLLTKEAAGSTVCAPIVGRVNKVPTAAQPTIGFEFDPNLVTAL